MKMLEFMTILKFLKLQSLGLENDRKGEWISGDDFFKIPIRTCS